MNIAAYRLPVQLLPGSKLMFERKARLATGQLSADMLDVAAHGADSEATERLTRDPYFNARLRTACIATRIKGGHAENALPRSASATINCRILPGTDPADVKEQLRKPAAEETLTFTSTCDARPSQPSILSAELQESLETLIEAFWPGVPLIPEMSTGASDALFLRNAGIPVFGIQGWFMRISDIRAHGSDEKINIAEFRQGVDFW